MQNIHQNTISKTVSFLTLVAFVVTNVVSPAQAQSTFNLPNPGSMVKTTTDFVPAIMKGLTVDPTNPFHFDFIIDTGDTGLNQDTLQPEAEKLVKYFLAALTVPEDQKWVNLSPYEDDRIIPESLGATELGRDMLAQDYMLKQLTASLMYPEDELGKKFWERVYAKAQQMYGTTDIPMNTFNKIWIVPSSATVSEYQQSAFVTERRLKVYLEKDYVALQKNLGTQNFGLDSLQINEADQVSEATSAVVREVLIPEIEREVNEGQIFANLRQIYNAMILATWYRRALKDSLLGQVYANQNKVAGIESGDPDAKSKIYDQYVEAFTMGVYDLLKEDYDPVTDQSVVRKYFSGGAVYEEEVVDVVQVSSPEEANNAMLEIDHAQLSTVMNVNVNLLDQRATEDTAVSGKFDNAQLNVNKEEALAREADFQKIAEAYDPQTSLMPTVEALMNFSDKFNGLRGENDEAQAILNRVMVEKSRLARRIGLDIVANDQQYQQIADSIWTDGFAAIKSFAKQSVADQKIDQKSADQVVQETERLLPEWLNAENQIPDFIRAGILRGFLEGRHEDILFAFGKGWRMFGTAGIRNPAVNSSFGVIADLELDEFAGREPGIESQRAPILTGPNLINVVNLLQQQRAITNVYRDIQAAFQKGQAAVDQLIKDKNLDPNFVNDAKNNKVSIAYDSRLNGKYFAHLLAAAFLNDGVSIDLFDSPAGVPAVVYQASENPENRSAIAILISASHSEANYNGFKVFMASQRSQVDVAGKNIVVGQRPKIVDVMPYEMQTKMGEMTLADFDGIFRQYAKADGNVRLKWFGNKTFNPDTNQVDAAFDGEFYDRYYSHVQQFSPATILDQEQNATALQAARNKLNIFYTAFGGVGAENAANLPAFLKLVGYNSVVTNKKQTARHDGSFAAFNKPGGEFGMPDPGVVRGWLINFMEFIQESAGEAFDNQTGLEQAIEALNARDISFATDPDADRGGVVLPLSGYEGGNIKEALLETIGQKMKELNVPAGRQAEVLGLLNDKFKDQLLLTANEAWSFIAFHKFRLMEQAGKLDKNKLYIIEKSHVTTDGLQDIARYFRDRGYNVHVVDTYVGFTELAKKSRDLYSIARMSWFIHQHLAGDQQEQRKDALQDLLRQFKGLNRELKRNVMYHRRGIQMIDDTIQALESYLKSGEGRARLVGLLNTVAHMEIPMGVEESNGYGEFGLFSPNETLAVAPNDKDWKAENIGRIEKEHISEKDGSLASFEFAEMLSVGQVTEKKSGFEMYLDMVKAVGAVGTDNRFLQYRGLTGDEKKLAAMRWLEQTFAVTLKRAIDQGKAVTLFNGRYTVKNVQIYRDAKYDVFWTGFPEEGVRLILEDKKGNTLFSTFRPSGTGANNRSYNWVFGADAYNGKPIAEMSYEELNAYRNDIVETLNQLALDFFGVQDVPDGYAQLDKQSFHGLLSAMGEVNENELNTMLPKFIDDPDIAQGLTQDETVMQQAADLFLRDKDFLKGAYEKGRLKDQIEERFQNLRRQNAQAWEAFLKSDDANAFNVEKFSVFEVNGQKTLVPTVYVAGWQTSFVDYLIGKIEQAAETSEKVNVDIQDPEILDLVAKRIPSVVWAKVTIPNVDKAQLTRLQSIDRTLMDGDDNVFLKAEKDGDGVAGTVTKNGKTISFSFEVEEDLLDQLSAAKDWSAVKALLEGKGVGLNFDAAQLTLVKVLILLAFLNFDLLVKVASAAVGTDVQTAGQAIQAQGKDSYGGINLNENMLDLQIKRDGKGVILPVTDQPIEQLKQSIPGFKPVIINITPIANVAQYLSALDNGADTAGADATSHGQLSLEPVDRTVM